MNATEKPKVWWTYDHAPTRWTIVGAFVVAWLIAGLLLFSDMVKILATRPWWEDLVVAVATIAVPILAYLELRHSAEANRFRGEANYERRRANDLLAAQIELEDKIGQRMVEGDIGRNRHLEKLANHFARPAEPASLRIYPDNRSRYILKPTGQGGIHGDFRGGHFQFSLRVENSGSRNSAVDRYKIWIQEFNREFDGIVPIQIHGLVPGRHCQHAVGEQKYLNEASLIKIPPDDSTRVGSLWFYLPDLTLEMFLNAGLRMQGPDRRFNDLHCRLTLMDSNGISASENFQLSED